MKKKTSPILNKNKNFSGSFKLLTMVLLAGLVVVLLIGSMTVDSMKNHSISLPNVRSHLKLRLNKLVGEVSGSSSAAGEDLRAGGVSV